MSGKTPSSRSKAVSPTPPRQNSRPRSAKSDRSESPGHSEWYNNAEKGKGGGGVGGGGGAGSPLVKSLSAKARSTGGRTPRKTNQSGGQTPRTPRSRTPRSGTPTGGSDDGSSERLPLYMQPTFASRNKSRKPPTKSASVQARFGSGDETGLRGGGKGAGARQDSRGLNKSWTAGNTGTRRRPKSIAGEAPIVGEGIIPKGHVGGKASPPLDVSRAGSATPSDTPSKSTSQGAAHSQKTLKKDTPGSTHPEPARPPPLVITDGAVELETNPGPEAKSSTKSISQSGTSKGSLAKRSPPGAGTPRAGTPNSETSKAGTPKAGTPKAGTPKAGTPRASIGKKSPQPSNPPKVAFGRTSPQLVKNPEEAATAKPTTPKKARTPKSPRPQPIVPMKEGESEKENSEEEVVVVQAKKKRAPAACEVTPIEDPKPSGTEPGLQEGRKPDAGKAGDNSASQTSVAKKVKRRLFGCIAPSRKSVSYD